MCTQTYSGNSACYVCWLIDYCSGSWVDHHSFRNSLTAVGYVMVSLSVFGNVMMSLYYSFRVGDATLVSSNCSNLAFVVAVIGLPIIFVTRPPDQVQENMLGIVSIVVTAAEMILQLWLYGLTEVPKVLGVYYESDTICFRAERLCDLIKSKVYPGDVNLKETELVATTESKL
jgi:uncharacterized membrane protein